MSFSPIERQRVREGIARVRDYSTHEWRQYFSYLLGRPVSLEEADEFLRSEQSIKALQERQEAAFA